MSLKITLISLLYFFCVTACNSTKSFKRKNISERITNPQRNSYASNARYVNFTVNVKNTHPGALMSVISIYDKQPDLGGRLLSRGSALPEHPFCTKIYLFNDISSVYIVKTASYNTSVISKLSLSSNDVFTSFDEL